MKKLLAMLLLAISCMTVTSSCGWMYYGDGSPDSRPGIYDGPGDGGGGGGGGGGAGGGGSGGD